MLGKRIFRRATGVRRLALFAVPVLLVFEYFVGQNVARGANQLFLVPCLFLIAALAVPRALAEPKWLLITMLVGTVLAPDLIISGRLPAVKLEQLLALLVTAVFLARKTLRIAGPSEFSSE